MPVKPDPSGRRSVEAETEVSGTPEEVWQTIATGPGISAWFVPTRLEEREGGAIVTDFGPGMESKATIALWDPPRCFVAENSGDVGPGSPLVATEWTVEAKAGGTCRVRVAHSWSASNDEYDGLYESVAQRWPDYFAILKLYLAHFRGQPRELIQLHAISAESTAAVWDKLLAALGLASMTVGQRIDTAAAGDAPRLAGIVERVDEGREELLLRLEGPISGIARLFAVPMGGQGFLSVRLYLYGAQAKAVAAREAPKWQEWLHGLFPPADAPA